MYPVVTHYQPMAPTLVRAPFHRDGWVYEEKVDCWRMLVYKDASASAWSAATGATNRGRVCDTERRRFIAPPRRACALRVNFATQ